MKRKNLLFYIYQIYKFIVYMPFLALCTAVLTTITIVLTLVFGQKAGTIIGKIWAKLNAYMIPMFIKKTGIENIKKDTSYIVVANHQSQVDIFAIYGWLPVDFRWVMKMELRKIPFLGYFCYIAGHIFIDRSNSASALESINKAKENIKNGISILFFPEGTRTLTGELLPFKKGAFKFALDTNLPILPITLIGTMNILPSNTMDLFPGKAKMIIHEPIDISSYSEENIQDLMDKVRDIFETDIKNQTL